MTDTLVIEAQGLGKTYGTKPDGASSNGANSNGAHSFGTDSFGSGRALQNLDLQVAAGSIHALLGKNGAGKTTLIKILLNMVKPDQGSARVFGLNATSATASVAIRHRLGFVSESKDLIQDMTVQEILQFTAAFYPAWDKGQEAQYRNRFELPLDRQIKQLSQGMRSKLALLLVLCRHAELLVLDEPTAGLDPAAAEDVLQAIVSHVAHENTTVLFSSHQIVEVEQIADHVTIMHQGRAAASGEIDSLKESYCRIQLVFADAAPEINADIPGVVRIESKGRTLAVISRSGSAQVLQQLAHLHPHATEVLPLTLKEIFFEEVGKHE